MGWIAANQNHKNIIAPPPSTMQKGSDGYMSAGTWLIPVLYVPYGWRIPPFVWTSLLLCIDIDTGRFQRADRPYILKVDIKASN